METIKNNIQDLTAAAAPVFIVHNLEQAQEVREAGGTPFCIGNQTILQFVADLKKESIIPQHILILTAGEKDDFPKDFFSAADALDAAEIPYNTDGALIFRGKSDPDQMKDVIAKAEQQERKEQEKGLEQIKNESAAAYLQEFVDGIAAGADTPAQPTGFNELDTVLDGGLYEGLYAIGGVPSLGKTAFILQIADQIAAQGRAVLIFSLEMARTELMSRSISRHTIIETLRTGGPLAHAKTNRGITTGARWKHYSAEEKALINTSINSYAKYADNVYIVEGVGDIGVNEIRGKVSRFVTHTGRTPVVVVDYLQILAPVNPRATDKQNADKNVIELKRISRDFKTSVIAISSFNRPAYKKEVDLDSFKESGGIEYTADVAIGLQFVGISDKDFDEKIAKDKDPREIEFVILKNRSGRTGIKLEYRYYPKFNYFSEV